MSFDYYRDRVLKKGNTNQDRILFEKKRSFEEYLQNIPTAHNVIIDGQEYLVSIQDVKFHDMYQEDKYMLTHMDLPIDVGSYVEWDSEVWLIRTKENESLKDHQTYRMAKSNHTLKFIDSNNNLITKPCIVSAKTLYNTGVKDEKVIEIPNGMVGIQLPYDEDTKKLTRGQDFVFNKTKYKLTFYNEVEFDGLVVLICDETEISHLDDQVNGVADRWMQVGNEKVDRLPWLDSQEPPEEPDPTDPPEPIEGITYTILGQPEFPSDPDNEIWYNSWCVYTVKKLADDVEIQGNFNFTLSNTNATLTDITNNSCRVNVGETTGVSTISLIVTDTDTSQVAIEKEIKIIGR